VKIALLFFGLLNSFEKVYGSKRKRPSLADVFSATGIDYDIFVDTSPIDFLKVPTGTSIDDIRSLSKGRPLLDRIRSNSEQEYMIFASDEAEITHRLQQVFSSAHMTFNFTPGDYSTWRGNFGERLIMTFMERKERLVRAAISSGIGYDYAILARPDYVIKSRDVTQRGLRTSEALSQITDCLRDDLSTLDNSNCLGITQMGIQDEREPSGDILLVKNGYSIGRLYEMVLATNLVNIAKAAGGYRKIFTRKAYLCNACRTLTRDYAEDCDNCAAVNSFKDISRYSEYKLGELIQSSGIKWTLTRLFGRALR